MILAAPPALGRLLASYPDLDELILLGSADPFPAADFYLPLLSVAGALGVSASTIPCQVPYLWADRQLTDAWRQRLAEIDGFKIGIAWQGSSRYKMDRWRSFPLAELAPLARLPGVKLIGLQKGLGSQQVATIDFPVLDLSGQLDQAAGPFMDTAAVIANLDLVVTADSVIAHLAGALGAPVWVALSVAADWRWLEGRDDSPWYPTMRLFRQTTLGQWPDVFQRMAEAVEQKRGKPPDGFAAEVGRQSVVSADRAAFQGRVALDHAGPRGAESVACRRSLPCGIGPIELDFPVVQAALSGYSDWAMRVIARRLGAPYTLCEVLLDQFVIQVSRGKRADRYLRVTDEEHPVGAQLMGANPEDFAPAARRLVAAGFDVIDINFGCPVKKVLGRCRGGYLLGQVETALEIVARVREAVPAEIPVTVKMRRGLDDSQASRDNFYQHLRRRLRARCRRHHRSWPHRRAALRRAEPLGIPPRAEAACRQPHRAGQRRSVHAASLSRHDRPDRRRRRHGGPRSDRQSLDFSAGSGVGRRLAAARAAVACMSSAT